MFDCLIMQVGYMCMKSYRTILPSKGHLKMFRIIFGCHNREGTNIYREEARKMQNLQ